MKRRLWVLTLASVVSFGCLTVSQVALAQASPRWIFGPPLAFTVVYYLVSLSVNGFTRGFDLANHQQLVRDWRPEGYPSVDVFLPVCGEPIEVLRNTWDARPAAWPTTTRAGCTVYVLDDSATELQAMAADFGFALPAPAEPGLVQEGRQPALRVRAHPTATTS